MKVNLSLKGWKYLSDAEGKRIAGQYAVNAGATEMSATDFNDGYNATKLVFSNELMADIEKLTERISNEIKENFFGKEGE